MSTGARISTSRPLPGVPATESGVRRTCRAPTRPLALCGALVSIACLTHLIRRSHARSDGRGRVKLPPKPPPNVSRSSARSTCRRPLRTRQPGTQTGAKARSDRRGPSIDVAAFAASASVALDAHPSTWTSYAELCAANGLDRGLASVVARQLGPAPTGQHWFRIRNSDGVYDVPASGAGRSDPVRFSQAAADSALEAIGIGVRCAPGRPRTEAAVDARRMVPRRG